MFFFAKMQIYYFNVNKNVSMMSKEEQRYKKYDIMDSMDTNFNKNS